MKNLILWLIGVFASTIVVPQEVPAQPLGLMAEQEREVEGAIGTWMTKYHAPGLSVAIVIDNEIRWAKGFGVSDVVSKSPAHSTTAYRLASISKSVTATAVMQLAERGSLDLDAPIQKYCPAFPTKKWPLTSRQLLAHLGGVRHNKDSDPTNRHFESITDALDYFKNDPLLDEPGTKYHYSTPGYTILGCVIEGASGSHYIDYIDQNILKPAQMSRTFPDDLRTKVPDRATPYLKSGKAVKDSPPFDSSSRLPGGGLVSTVEDLSRFAIALLDGKLVKTETLEQIWTRQKTRTGKTLEFYGLGWLIREAQGNLPKQVWNDGSQPGTRTYLYVIPEKRFAIALMTNLYEAWCEELVTPIRKIVLQF